MKEKGYDGNAAVLYARKWALSRNPAYYDFEDTGGDCTNFASQCVFSGAKVMNYTKDTGWYYNFPSDRAAAWSGVEYLCAFLLNNEGPGPYGKLVGKEFLKPGDIVQLGGERGFYHTAVITMTEPEILVCAHTSDAYDRPLASYRFERARFISITGVRI